MKEPRNRHAIFVGAFLLAILSAVFGMRGDAGVGPGTVARAIQMGSLRRSYLVPPVVFPQGGAKALLFVLHGGGGSGRVVERLGFSALADREGFVVVYLDAVNGNWNDGRNAQSIRAQREHVDDVGFVAALIATLTKEFDIDPRRVYSTGISNGGFMSHRLAVEMSDRITAIAPVAGGLALPLRERFGPRTPVSVLIINGTADRLVPFQGGRVARNRGEMVSVPETVRLWVTHNRCPSQPNITLLPDRDPADGTRVRRSMYGPCAGKTDVVLYTVEGGGHTWPGGKQYLPIALIGRVNRDIDATQLIWEFFDSHPRP